MVWNRVHRDIFLCLSYLAIVFLSLGPRGSRVGSLRCPSPLILNVARTRQSDMVIGDRCGDARLLKQRGVIVDSDCEW